MSDPTTPPEPRPAWALDWQRFTHDVEDVSPVERCGARSAGHGRHHNPDECPTCAAEMAICLRRKDHGGYWHEGRSRQGNLVSWPPMTPPEPVEAQGPTSMTEPRYPYDPWGTAERENACGDQECEIARREAALLVLRGGATHRQYADLVHGAVRAALATSPEGGSDD